MNKVPATRLRNVAAAALTAPLLLAGCGGAMGNDDAGDRPRVVASFYPLAYVAERVGGEHTDVVTLTSPGVDPHDLELSVRQTAEIAGADLVVYEKGMQPAIDEAVDQNGPDQVVEATQVVDLVAFEEHTADDHADDHAEDPHADEHADDDHADDHGHGDKDLHFWVDPERMVDLAAAVRDEMSVVDPENAADYESAFQDLRDDLLEIDLAYAEGLSKCEVDTVVVSHDAFRYLEKYGLHFEPIAGLSPDAEPSAAHLRELQDLIRSEGVTTVFSERLASPAMAQTLARDLGIETDVLDPIEGLGDETADEDYLSLMRSNLEALRAANRCR
ncbi:MAG TPA: metal ABC transporter substrate-binding protein [Nocardioidaceae bacterium]|nr:metal ABC transporter substrate-binding protein [Nocardioidaceae bacterium]